MKQVALKSSARRSKSFAPEKRENFAAKIHEMRQPLQAMSLLHSVLAEKVKDEEAQKLIFRLEEMLGSLSRMLKSFSEPTAGTKSSSSGKKAVAETIPPAKEMAISPHLFEKLNMQPSICIIDDDADVREGMGTFLSSVGHSVELYESCEHFLKSHPPDSCNGCLLIDALLPGMSGLELLHHLQEKNYHSPAIMVTGNGDVTLAVEAMKAGAVDFIEKPVNPKELLAVITDVLQQAQSTSNTLADREAAVARLACLSARERQIMDWIFEGHQSKNIAADLGISRRTVEAHRASIMKKTGVRSLSGLLKLALAAAA